MGVKAAGCGKGRCQLSTVETITDLVRERKRGKSQCVIGGRFWPKVVVEKGQKPPRSDDSRKDQWVLVERVRNAQCRCSIQDM